MASHRHRPRLPPHSEADVRAYRQGRGLRFPPASPDDLRARDAGEKQRRHLPGDDEENPGCGVRHHRGPRSSLSSRARPVAVLQFSTRDPHRHRRVEAVVCPRRAAATPAPPRGRCREVVAGCWAAGAVTPAYQEFYRGRRVMITGGLGFIGSNLALKLAELGSDVLLMDSLIPGSGANFFNIREFASKVRVNIADVRQESTMNHLVRDREVIFN